MSFMSDGVLLLLLPVFACPCRMRMLTSSFPPPPLLAPHVCAVPAAVNPSARPPPAAASLYTAAWPPLLLRVSQPWPARLPACCPSCRPRHAAPHREPARRTQPRYTVVAVEVATRLAMLTSSAVLLWHAHHSHGAHRARPSRRCHLPPPASFRQPSHATKVGEADQ